MISHMDGFKFLKCQLLSWIILVSFINFQSEVKNDYMTNYFRLQIKKLINDNGHFLTNQEFSSLRQKHMSCFLFENNDEKRFTSSLEGVPPPHLPL